MMKSLKETQSRLTGMLGFKMKIEEHGDPKLSMLLPNNNPWKGAPCGRADCVTCNQGGDRLPDCTRRNKLYENICTVCNPDRMEKSDTIMDDRDTPSVYVGETSCSINEGALEHWKEYLNGDPDSHIRKHWTLHHDGIGEPQFVFKVVRQFRDALSRQVAEAIRIMLRQNTLNSKNS